MALTVTLTEDPAIVREEAGDFLRADPVQNFTMLTLLHERIWFPQPGRYWIVKRDGVAEGVVFQSPLDFPTVLVSSMQPDAIDAVVEAIAGAGIALPGVGGPSSTATAFADRWSEVANVTAEVTGRERLYEAKAVVSPSPFEGEGWGEGVSSRSDREDGRSKRRPYQPAPGRLRQAEPSDRDLLVEWMRGFHANHPHADPERMVDTRLPSGLFWIWDDDSPVSAACQSRPMESVVSIQAVWTPSELRNRGYASTCVYDLTARIRASGHRAILYTNFSNKTADSIYRRIGYAHEGVFIRYRFERSAELGRPNLRDQLDSDR